jgi:hypothetical protein
LRNLIPRFHDPNNSLLAIVKNPTRRNSIMTSSVGASRFAFVAPAFLFGALAMGGAARAAAFDFTDTVQTYDVTTSGICDITAAGGQGAGGGGGAIIGGDALSSPNLSCPKIN